MAARSLLRPCLGQSIGQRPRQIDRHLLHAARLHRRQRLQPGRGRERRRHLPYVLLKRCLLNGSQARRRRESLHLPRGRLRLRPRQQISRLLPNDQLPAGRGEHRHQADLGLLAAHLVPGHPHAVARAQFRRAVMLRELLGREGVFAVGRLAVAAVLAVIIGIHDELPLDRHGIVLRVIEVQPAAEPAGRRLARRIQHCRRPDHRQPRRPRELTLRHLRLISYPPLCPLGRRKRLATGEATH